MVRRLVGMVVRLLIFLGFLAGLLACQPLAGSFCRISRPIHLSDAAVDALGDQEVKVLLSHNRKGAALCGWKP